MYIKYVYVKERCYKNLIIEKMFNCYGKIRFLSCLLIVVYLLSCENLSSDSTLKMIKVNDTKLSNFKSNVYQYIVEVTNDVNEIRVDAVTNNSYSKVKITALDPNEEELSVKGSLVSGLLTGNNIIYLNVEAEDGNKDIYKIIVTKIPSENADLSELKISEFNLDKAFNADSLQYIVEIGFEISSLEFNLKASSGAATIYISANNSSDHSLHVDNGVIEGFTTGKNVVIVTVTAESKKNNKTYIIYVNKALSSNPELEALSIQGVEFDREFIPGNFEYNAEVSAIKSNIIIQYSSMHHSTVVQIKATDLNEKNLNVEDNSISLFTGVNKIELLCISEDKSKTLTYKIFVNKLPSSDATLSNLSITGVQISPIFEPPKTDYSAYLDEKTDNVLIVATLSCERAKLNISADLNKGNSVTIDNNNRISNIKSGKTKIDLQVIAEDNVTEIVYSLVLVKK